MYSPCFPQSVDFRPQHYFFMVTKWLLQFILTQQHAKLAERLPVLRLLVERKETFSRILPGDFSLAKVVLVHLNY